jgi:hypothetical protein
MTFLSSSKGGIMFGTPGDVDGDCNARLFIGDDYGDNVCTIRCALAPNHAGPHEENFERGGKPVKITWECDERESIELEDVEEE